MGYRKTVTYVDEYFVNHDDGKSIDRIGRADKAVSILTDSCVNSSYLKRAPVKECDVLRGGNCKQRVATTG